MLPREFELYGHRFRWSDEAAELGADESAPFTLIRMHGPFPSEKVEWLSRSSGYVPGYGKLGDCSAYQFDGVASFLFPSDGRFLKIFPDPEADHTSLEFVLFRGVLPRLLHLRGTTSLHASAVAVPGGVVAFCGPSGAGKSTLAAALVSRGLAVVSDDVVPLRPNRSGGVDALPGLPDIRVYPATAELLGIAGQVVAPLPGQLKSHWQPRRAPETPLPLLGIYLLDASLRGTEPDAAKLLPMSRSEALIGLISNSYWVHPRETAALGKDMLCLGQVLRSVPVARLVYELTETGFDAVEELIGTTVTATAL